MNKLVYLNLCKNCGSIEGNILRINKNYTSSWNYFLICAAVLNPWMDQTHPERRKQVKINLWTNPTQKSVHINTTSSSSSSKHTPLKDWLWLWEPLLLELNEVSLLVKQRGKIWVRRFLHFLKQLTVAFQS